MDFLDINGQRYIVYKEADLLGLGFETHGENSYFLKPGATNLGLDGSSNKKQKAVDSFYHFHLITIAAPDGKLGLDSIKVKCGTKMGWWMIRKFDGRFRLSGNTAKYGKKGWIQPDRISPQKKYDYGTVTAMLAHLPTEWFTPEKSLTQSAQALIAAV
jgi:hypothetical protein